MGCFSWINSDTGYNILGGEKINLLCPDGTVLSDSHYDSYGNIAGHDAYFLLAMWNRKEILTYLIKDCIGKTFGKDEYLELFFNKNISDEYLYESEEEIADTIREIGIFIYFLEKSDLREQVVKYPLKFVEDITLKYEDVKESVDDPEQGFGRYHIEKGSYLGTCASCGNEIWENENYYGESEEGPVCSSACEEDIRSYYEDEDEDDCDNEDED